jgi:hypothetical protein
MMNAIMHLCRILSPRLIAVAAVFALATTFAAAAPAASGSIQGKDANGRQVTVNGTGHYTFVLYTNPDLEDSSRQVTVAMDPFRGRSDFSFVRIVDLRGGVPAGMRSIVNAQIRQEQVKEDLRLKKAGVDAIDSHAPIIPDFNGSTLDALGWSSIYDQLHLVVYDRDGREVKRLENVDDPKQVTKVVESIL